MVRGGRPVSWTWSELLPVHSFLLPPLCPTSVARCTVHRALSVPVSTRTTPRSPLSYSSVKEPDSPAAPHPLFWASAPALLPFYPHRILISASHLPLAVLFLLLGLLFLSLFFQYNFEIPRRGTWQPTPVFLPGESHGQRNLAGCSPHGCTESDTTEPSSHACTFIYFIIY